MDKWAAPLLLITILIFGVILFFTQGKAKEEPNIPTGDETFKTLALSPAASLTPPQAQQQQQQQAQQQQQPAGNAEMGPPKASSSATIRTNKGNIKISLVLADAPNAIANFLEKAKSGYWKNLTWHRVEDWVVQGGDPTGTGTGGQPFQTELNQKPFTTGAVGWAASNNMQVGQGARISNDSQFFIVTQDASWLNGQYSNFATVTEGIDVAKNLKVGDKILSVTIDK
jgi:peptidyl-prolyl cis-trans isomerase B (cyclophilin B)